MPELRDLTIKTRRTVTTLLLTLTCLYVVLLTIISIINQTGSDRWWFGALNLYLPQMIWAIPGILLTLFMLIFAREWAWVPLLCVIWVFGHIMGLCWHLSEPANSSETPVVRVMTWNIKYGSHGVQILIDEIIRNKPDLVFLQDSENSLSGPLGSYFREWNVSSFGQYVVASRFPLTKAEVCWTSFPDRKWPCLRCQLHLGTESIILYNVHFNSPRDGLNTFRMVRKRPKYLPEAIHQIDNNAEVRLTQARAVLELIRQEQGPVIVAGDLNSTDTSLPCLILREAGLRDAFAEGGRGYGYTYGHFLLHNRVPFLNLSWMRIDHIMMNSQLQSRRCWTGTAKASDHRPVVADLVLKRP